MHNALFFLIFQVAQTQSAVTPPVRGDKFEIVVPQGWKTLNDGGYVLLEHSSGASLLIQRIDRPTNLPEYAQRQAERVMLPLGFATLGEPRSFKEGRDEWVEYEIRGTRLTAHRRILYRVLRRDNNFFEVVYEAGEERFDSLRTEAQEIASSVQSIIEAPPPVRRRRR